MTMRSHAQGSRVNQYSSRVIYPGPSTTFHYTHSIRKMSSESNADRVGEASASASGSGSTSTSIMTPSNAEATASTNGNGVEEPKPKPRARLGPIETLTVPAYAEEDSDSEADEDADAPAVDGDKGEGEGAGDDFLKSYPDDTEVRLRPLLTPPRISGSCSSLRHGLSPMRHVLNADEQELHLQHLRLKNASLGPLEINRFTHLKRLCLRQNELSSPLPEGVFDNLGELDELDMYDNRLGPIIEDVELKGLDSLT
jgi:protein phosphatase 1 regulatory subunit 7